MAGTLELSQQIGITGSAKAPQKTIHQGPTFDIEQYVEALEVPEEQLKNTLNWMVEQLSDQNKETLRVLIIGPGAGRIEVPFVEALSSHRSIDVTFVDYGSQSNKKLREQLRNCGYNNQGKQNQGERWEKTTISCTLLEEDFEEWSTSKRYDVIVAFFVVNFFSDWTGSLKKILSLLEPNGVFFFSEDTHDIRFVDNTFYPVDDSLFQDRERSLFYRLWRKYYQIREQKGYAWQPLISPSNMSLVIKILQDMENAKYGSVKQQCFEWKSAKLSWSDWLKIIRSKDVFNCLSIIPSKLRNQLADEVEKWLKSQLKCNDDFDKKRPKIKVGHKIIAYKKPAGMHPNPFTTIVDYVIKSEYAGALLQTLAYHKPYDLKLDVEVTRMTDHVRRLISTHDQLPLKGRSGLSVVSWYLNDLRDPGKGGWSPEIPILLPGQLMSAPQTRQHYCLTYAIYMCLTHYKKHKRSDIKLISDILLHLLPHKLAFEFNIDKEEAIGVKCLGNGTLTAIRITLAKQQVQEIRKEADGIVKQMKASISCQDLDEPLFEFPRLPIISFEQLLKTSEALWNHTTFRDNIIKLFRKLSSTSQLLQTQIENYFRNSNKQFDIDFTPFASSLAIIAYANTIIGAGTEYEWTRAFFVPATSLALKKTLDGKDQTWEVGLLGFICYESPLKVNDRNPQDNPSLLSEYLEYLLNINANVYGLEDTIQQYAKLIRKESFRSAIAAVIGRNMSHNIGSHAIWHLVEQLQNSKMDDNDIKMFLRYLQKRMDFIAQVSTSAPSWCLTMRWRDLIEEFREQKCLLDNIAWSHKVRYSHGWFDTRVSTDKKPEVKLIISPQFSEGITVDIPHGKIGVQAFYTILENLIRNTAKYGDRSSAPSVNSSPDFKKLEFTIKVDDDWDDQGKGWKETYYRVSIRDNWQTQEAVVKQLNDSLAAPILDPETAELKPGNWGMKEIKICAAYLRMVRPEEIDAKYDEWKERKGEEPPMIEVRLTNHNWRQAHNQGHLTYVLYLLRPKQALLVGEALKKAAAPAEISRGEVGS